MAIAFDAISASLSASAVNSGTNRSGNITIAAGATVAIAFVEISLEGGNDDSLIDVSSITLGGNSMTLVPSSLVHSGTANHGKILLYRLFSPPTGTVSFSVTITHSGTPGATGELLAYCCSYTGDLQSGAELGTAQTSTTNGAASQTISDTLASGDLFVGHACNGSTTPGVTTGTSRGTVAGSTATASHAGINVADNSGTGAVSIVFSTNAADSSAASGVKLVAATVAPPTPALRGPIRSALRLA